MIVCLCHRVSDRDIAREVAQGCTDFMALQRATHVATGCGACLDCAHEIFEHRQQALVQALISAQSASAVGAVMRRFPASPRPVAIEGLGLAQQLGCTPVSG